MLRVDMRRVILFSLALLLFPHGASATTVFLTSGTSWTVPSDWNNSDNTVEVIGGGAGGSSTGYYGGGGGGGYSKSVNVTLSGSVGYAVGSGGSVGNAGTDTYFCNSSSNCGSIVGSAVVVGAKGGATPSGTSGAAGGASASGVASGTGSLTYSGGNGGNGSAGVGGGGGGGAAGPNGAGSNGNSTCCGNAGGSGGSGDAGSGGSGGVGNSSDGGNGTEWDATHGSGGGGGGGGNSGNPNCTASNGGYYGAGGGSSACSPYAGGVGRAGLIVITYTPSYDNTFTKKVTVRGNMVVTGGLSKGSGSFVIDHPLDPKNKLLYHSFVESPDVKNIYDGIATLDEKGEASVQLPKYFLALNKDFRYLLFAMGEPMPNLYIARDVRPRFFGIFGAPEFKIAGGAPGGKVSWQVTGIRHDPYILAYPIIPEVKKGAGALYSQGMYVHPDMYKQDAKKK